MWSKYVYDEMHNHYYYIIVSAQQSKLIKI